jgi:hypothetical protein
LLKWLVLIALLVLVLLAIFLPDRGLATPPGATAQRSTQPNPTPPRTETPPGAWQA